MPRYLLEFDMKGSGFTVNDTLGETHPNHRLTHLDVDERWHLANTADAASSPLIGVTMGAGQTGKQCEILLWGYIGDPEWNWRRGDRIRATPNPGELSSEGGGTVVGTAIKQTMICFTGSFMREVDRYPVINYPPLHLSAREP